MTESSSLPTNAVPSRPKLAPGPSSLGVLNMGVGFIRDPFAVLNGASAQYGPIVRFQVGKKCVHLIHDPDMVQRVLLDNNTNYNKSSPYGFIKLLFGKGLLFNEGKSWFAQRRLLQPIFMPKHFSGMAEGIGAAIAENVATWPRVAGGEKTDIEQEMAHLARRIVGEFLFGENLSDDVNKIAESGSDGSKSGFLLGNIPGTPHNLKFKSEMAKLDKAVYDIIATRRALPAEDDSANDLLSAMMRAVDKSTGEKMDDLQLRDEIVTLLFSGFDTTSRTLSWGFHALSKNPHVEAKLHEELDRVLGGRMPTYDDLPKLVYTDMFIKETMRVFPPNAIIGRQAKEDDVIGGYHIPAGSLLTISPYLAQRDPKYWDQPEVFDPERWAPDKEAPGRFNYFPFGGGPRQCIGKGLAMMTLPFAVATIAQQFRWSEIPEFPVGHDMKLTFQSKRGIWAMRHTRGVLAA
ncbi:MAG TPA: cytochrome P450 [Abditibacteriaceae bacterium]|jgi:cytochrome P450